MLEIVKAGGWLMVPLLLCSVAALTIILERLFVLRSRRVMPPGLLLQVRDAHRGSGWSAETLLRLRQGSPLGRIFAAGLVNHRHSRAIMQEAIIQTGRQVVVELERYLNALGTIAAITPLLGLLGTVVGMIKVFAVIVSAGVGDPAILAQGISEALVTTAAGLAVAIPALMFYRYFTAQVERLAVAMEAQALRMVEIIQGEREPEPGRGE